MPRNRLYIFGIIVACVSLGILFWTVDLFDFRNKAPENCEQSGSPPACWEKQIESILQKKGLVPALDLFLTLNATQPSFSTYCHEYAHRLGTYAYNIYRSKKTLVIHPQMQYCAFGFYHGLMLKMTSESGSTNEAKQFCEYLESELKKQVSVPSMACYHGVGHGIAEISIEREKLHDEEEIVKKAAPLCHSVAHNTQQLEICLSGIFDTLAIAYYNDNKYPGIHVRMDNPLWLCQKQPDEYRAPCYNMMMSALWRITNADLTSALAIFQKHVEQKHKPRTLQTLMADTMRERLSLSPAELVTFCDTLDRNLYASCVLGTVDGITEFGSLDTAHEKALAVCAEAKPDSTLQNKCYSSILGYLKSRYPQKKVFEICRKFPASYQSLCKIKTN